VSVWPMRYLPRVDPMKPPPVTQIFMMDLPKVGNCQGRKWIPIIIKSTRHLERTFFETSLGIHFKKKPLGLMAPPLIGSP
jgi:hypothetical protein